ncbi:hypothetical protein [Actinokineospora inagensis]|uniref:hypothetical protein n=1 Tax=Actinokineospora inagensis TaxID=103730 RepID=UPI0003F54F9B|nr:hypothetical protein [Actinokineospora inagensis]
MTATTTGETSDTTATRPVPLGRGYWHDLVVQLADAGIAVRELAPLVSPLEAAFLALTKQTTGGGISGTSDTTATPPIPLSRYRYDLVVRLVHAGLAVRELAPLVSPLEAAFLALTEQTDQPEAIR